MRFRWIVYFVLLAGAGVAGALATRSLGLWTPDTAVRPVPPGDQEIAWIAPATSGDAWERLVAALTQLQQDWSQIHGGQAFSLQLDRAFLEMTAEVPEIGLNVGGSKGRLWIRWYKLSGDNDSNRWIANLRGRQTPPLAIVGGDTSDRALELARALRDNEQQWTASAPLFLITTATAERYAPKDSEADQIPHEDWPTLMSVYAGRTFRFAFTNSRMVQAVLDFVQETPQVWPQKNNEPTLFAGVTAAGDVWTGLGFLSAAGQLQPYYIYRLAWGDDGYSKDLAEIFSKQFAERVQEPGGKQEVFSVADANIPYSVGDQYQANPRENLAVDWFLINRGGLRDRQHLLVLPTGAQRARRFLSTLCRRAPLEMRNVVVVNGDAISFNTIYRDRDVAWNILDMPVPLVFFSHRNPIDPAAGFDPQKAATGTQDVLLDRDIFEALVQCAFDGNRLLAEADSVRARLMSLRYAKQHVGLAGELEKLGRPFFDTEGNRHSGTGEHIVWLQPTFEGTRNLPQATISVWHVSGTANRWKLTGRPLAVSYNRILPGG